jgi:hypothetical protein
MFNNYSIGGFLIWKLPSQKVYVDGRMGTTWQRPDNSQIGPPGENYFKTWKEINDNESTETLRQEVFDKFNITCVVTNKGAKLVESLRSDQNWREVIGDDNGWILLKKQIDV